MTTSHDNSFQSEVVQGLTDSPRRYEQRWSVRGALRTLAGAVFFAIVGFGFAIRVLGARLIDPTNSSWVTGDTATSYLGWLFFRNENYLSFPLGWSSSIGYPKGEPIAYLDSIPLVATLFWPFRHSLPADFQYLGLWWALCTTLQFYFGYRVCKHFAGDNKAICILGGLFFMIAPPFVWRASRHFPLSGQWLIVAALDFYLSSKARPSRLMVGGGILLCFIAGSINPYLALMTLMLIAAGYLRSLLSQDPQAMPVAGRIFRAACGFGLSAAATLLAFFIFGFLRLNDPGSYAGGGYGFYSMNLLAPIDPENFGSLLLKQLPIGEGQYEGYNYFGLGVLLLGIVSLAYRPRAIFDGAFRRENLPGWLIAAISLLLALSLKATVGHVVLYDIPAPPAVLDVLSAFRASGRLFWVAFYLSLSGVFGMAIIAFGRKASFVIFGALVLQVTDLSGLYGGIHDGWQDSTTSTFTNTTVWQKVGLTHKHLVVIPAWQCADRRSPGGIQGFWIFGKFAAEHGMTINSFYAGRISPGQMDYFCREQPSEISRNGLDDNTAYVFNDLSYVLPLTLNDHFCRGLDDVILCSKEADRRGIDHALLPANTGAAR